jgi:hypothetical protein
VLVELLPGERLARRPLMLPPTSLRSTASSGWPPNTRVQRTRSPPSALRSRLTRHPLGGTETVGEAE